MCLNLQDVLGVPQKRPHTVIREYFVVKNFSFCAKRRKLFASNIYYSEYMVRVRYERKYCYTKISNSKILRKKLMQITVIVLHRSAKGLLQSLPPHPLNSAKTTFAFVDKNSEETLATTCISQDWCDNYDLRRQQQQMNRLITLPLIHACMVKIQSQVV